MLKRKLAEVSKKWKLSNSYLLGIMLVAIVVLLILSTKKEGMHVDEYYTYGLANHVADGEITPVPECGIPLTPSDIFDTYFYAETFSLKNVWLNQSVDVHPPLYYLIFHIWGLLTHNFLGLKTGILLNVLLHIVNIGLIFLIFKELLSKESMILVGSGMYAFNPIILGNVLYIRMYALFSTFILLLILLLLREWMKEKTVRHFYFKLGGISILGALTHYYFLIYLFFSCCVWGMRLLIKHKGREVLRFAGTMLLSGGICVAIFPYMLQQIFTGNRGQESINKLLDSSWLFNIRFFGGTFDKISGGFSLAILSVAVLMLLYKIGAEGFKIADNRAWFYIILVPGIFYVLLVSKMAVMLATRYIAPLYGSWIIVIMLLIKGIMDYIDKSSLRSIGAICIVALLLNAEWKMYTWPELYPEAKDAVEVAKEYGAHNECVYVYETLYRSMPTYQEFMQYPKITFIPEDNFDLLLQEHYTSQHNMVIYFDKEIGQEQKEKQMKRLIEFSPNMENYQKLYEYAYNEAYYLE